MNITQQVIIVSAEKSTETQQENTRRTTTLEHCLEDCNIVFNKASGVYKGKEEDSFVVLPRNEAEIEAVRDFAFKNFDQESILFQDSNQEAYLVFADGSEERLGRLQEVPQEVAHGLDAYTILNGKYYATVKRT